jgi:hypothetical protein
MFDIFDLKENDKKFDLLKICVVQFFENVLFVAAYYTKHFSIKIIR